MKTTWMLLLAPSLLALAPATARPPVDAGSLAKAADDPAASHAWALAELERALGDKEWKSLSTGGPRAAFFRELAKPDGLLDELMFSGPLPDDPAKMIRVAESLWKADARSMADRRELTTAAAVALTFGDGKWPEDQAAARYEYYRDSRKAGQLHPMFDTLETWEKRYVVSVSSNGGWAGDDGWGERSMEWLRDHVKLPAADYTKACWQAPYRLNNVFGDSIHGKNYYAPFKEMIHAERVREVGGVCGSLSHYGATAARSNGIPAITMGEPGHCAYAVRLGPGEWTPAYSLSWKRGLHTSLWGRTWTQLVLQDKVLAEKYASHRSDVHLWQARSLRDEDPDLAASAYRMAVEAQPLNQQAWLEIARWMKERRQPSPADWKAFHDQALAALADYPEAAWEVLAVFQPSVMPQVPADERIPFLLAFHDAIAARKGPVMWDFGKALDEQVKMLGGDHATELEFFEQVVAMQVRSETWLAPVVAWGRERFAKDPAGATECFNVLARGLAAGGGSSQAESLGKVLAPVILAAADTGNVDAFQALSKLAGTTPAKVPTGEPFPGELLSAGGLLKISTTSRWDDPSQHAAVLEASGGRFHTDKEVKPHAVVRLAKLGELSGIVLASTASGYNSTREVPLKVSVSEDGQQWTEVFRTEKPGGPWRIPLEGKAPRVGYVKVERDDDRSEVFHMNAIQVYGRRLQ
ncbi:hypothetical protein [Luteolibacter marinus]|uniref:hypothetical protein n=1 Tax=Luteolibacter marinus TaxID=2776705 RepID=UPI001867B2B3|nr:hypothetical protein [Luteolibacter marinus]